MNRHLILYIILFFVLGCEPSSDSGKKKYGGVLIYGSSVNPTIIHPFLTFDSVSVHILKLIFNGLTKTTKDGSLLPDLAESYEIKQKGLEYNITLKRGVKFHDGEELTSEDVKFTYEELRKIKKNNLYIFDYDFSMVKKIKIVDKYHIKIILEKPYVGFLFSLSVGILPKHIYKGENNVNSYVYWHPIGTGPFKLTDVDKKKIILECFEDYYKGKPYLDKIICLIDSSSIIWAKLLRGEIDYSKNIPLALLKEVKKVGFLKTREILESSCCLLLLNNNKPFLKDKRIRQALNYAIDKNLMVKTILHGHGKVSSGPVLPYSTSYNNSLKPYEYNPQKALGILKKSGWRINKSDGLLYKDGKNLNLKCLTLKGYPNILLSATFIQRQLNEIGIKMELKVVNSSEEFYKHKKNNDWDAFFGRIEISPESNRNYSYFHSSRIGTTNYCNYANFEIDKLLDLERITLKQEKQKKIYYKFLNILYNDPPGIFAYHKYLSFAINKKVKNAFPDYFDIFRRIENWWIDKDWEKHP
jgi:peptide/nickel transport system substrate-binding protein